MSQTKSFRREVEQGIRAAILAAPGFVDLISAEKVWTGSDAAATSQPSLRVLQVGAGLASTDTGPGKMRPAWRLTLLSASRANVDSAVEIIRKNLTIPTVRTTPIETTNFRITELAILDEVEPELPARPSNNGESILSYWILLVGRVVQKTQD